MEDGRFARPSIWLSMSGGGLRAAIFHYGCLKRLNELGLLGHVYAISATSGGSLIAAMISKYREATSYLDVARQVLLHQYNWPEFERTFLELVRRGVFGPTFMLVLAYTLYGAGILLFGIDRLLWSQTFALPFSVIPLALLLLFTAVILHLSLAWFLFRAGAHTARKEAQFAAKFDRKLATADWVHPNYRRLLKMLFVPSYLRWQTLNLRVFHGEPLRMMWTQPAVFLTAVELNSGKEAVFSSGLICPLDVVGSQELWEQRKQRELSDSGVVEVAQAVSASSAFPPLFRGITVENANGLVGVFVDGGVLDNYALHVPRSFSAHIHPYRSRYDRSKGGGPSFREATSFILVMDGAKAPQATTQPTWGRVRSGLRVLSILTDQQFEGALLSSQEFFRHSGIPVNLVGLQPGFPHGSFLDDEILKKYVSRIRTHLDSFSVEECAVLTYCGYMWINELMDGNAHFLERYEGVSWTPPLTFDRILPEYCGRWETSLSELRHHLRFSNRRLAVLRILGRKLGL